MVHLSTHALDCQKLVDVGGRLFGSFEAINCATRSAEGMRPVTSTLNPANEFVVGRLTGRSDAGGLKRGQMGPQITPPRPDFDKSNDWTRDFGVRFPPARVELAV